MVQGRKDFLSTLLDLIAGSMKQTDNGQIDRRKCLQIYFYFFRLSPVACGVFVPQLEIGSMPPALGTWSLNHWTTREVPTNLLIFNITCTRTSHDKRKSEYPKKKKNPGDLRAYVTF